MKRRIGSLAAALVAAIALAVPASAVTVETTHHVDTLTFPLDRCGYSWVGDVTLERLVQVRTVDAVTPPTIIENYELSVLWTDVHDADHQYRVETQGQARDVPIRLIEGTTWEFRWSDIGHPAQWRTAGGRIVAHDRGRLDITSLRDTLGDADPSNDIFLEETSFSTRGQFPSLTWDADAFCAVVLEAAAG